MFRAFPLLLVSVVIYNLLALAHGLASQSEMNTFLTGNGAVLTMFSGDVWHFTLGDLLLLISLVLLFIEVIKATRTSQREMLNHGLSLLTFVIALVEFIVLKGFSTSTFFFITVMITFDVVAGYSISVAAAKHSLGIGKVAAD
jgi:hypothetical protein